MEEEEGKAIKWGGRKVRPSSGEEEGKAIKWGGGKIH